jgi:hypothetical protein
MPDSSCGTWRPNGPDPRHSPSTVTPTTPTPTLTPHAHAHAYATQLPALLDLTCQSTARLISSNRNQASQRPEDMPQFLVGDKNP